MVQYRPLFENGTFEEVEALYREEGADFSSNVIMKVKTTNKTITVERGMPCLPDAEDRYTCPRLVLTEAKVTQLFHASDEFTHSIEAGDTVWLSSEYIVDEKSKLIYIPGDHHKRTQPISVFYLPDHEYLLYAGSDFLNGECIYKGNLIYYSYPQGAVPLGYSSWSDYAELLNSIGFPHYCNYSYIWDAAIEKYIK